METFVTNAPMTMVRPAIRDSKLVKSFMCYMNVPIFKRRREMLGIFYKKTMNYFRGGMIDHFRIVR